LRRRGPVRRAQPDHARPGGDRGPGAGRQAQGIAQRRGGKAMFNRIARLFKSWVGYFISFAEDPEVMLQEAIEEMRNTLPKLNQILITTRATVIRLEQGKAA